MNSSFKAAATVFSRTAVVLLGLGVLALLLIQPHFEGRNADATPFEIYFQDPFLAYAYVASVPFFGALLQLWKLLGYAGRNGLSSPRAVKALRTLRLCASVMPAFIVIGAAWLLSVESDDRPPILMMGMVTTGISLAVAAKAAALERKVRG